MKERIDGYPFDLDHLSDIELENLKTYAVQRLEAALQDIDRINFALMRRNQEALPMDGMSNYQNALGKAVVRSEITAPEAYEAIGNFES